MVTLAFAVPFAAVIKTVAADQAVIAADHESQSLAGVLGASVSRAALSAYLAQVNAGADEQATVVLSDGTRVGAPLALPADDRALADAGRAFTTSWDGATHVLVPVRRSGGQIEIGIVTVPGSLLRHGVLLAWTILAVVSIFIVLLGIVLADRLGRSLVSAIGRLGALTRRLQGGELDARVELDGPVEIQEVGETLNTLAHTIVEMLEHEREAAADLSHRLRTPLMALALEAETIRDADDRSKVNGAIAELTNAVTAVIRASRRGGEAPSVADLTEIAHERLAFWSALADEQGRQWSADLSGDQLVVALDPDEVRAALDALLTNVFAHTEEGVAFRVRTSGGDGGAELVVEDSGGGFVDDLVPMRGRSGGNSTGLGLDIVTQTARTSGGDVTFGRSSMGGAAVHVHFGAAPAVTREAEGESSLSSTAVEGSAETWVRRSNSRR
jgi:signal transduction histidine kinase